LVIRELLTMKSLLFAGVAGLSLLAAVPAGAASDSMGATTAKNTQVELGGVFEGRKGGGGHVGMPGMGGPKPGMHGPMPGMGPKPGMHGPGIKGPGMGGKHRWGHRMGGRWFAGFYAPGGWGGYQMPHRGFTLPTYWIQPTYRINNYPLYGLYAPQTGYGWTRYYDDAVLSDARGYVQDYRRDIPWDRYEGGYAPGDYAEPDYGPAMGADRGVYYGDDRVYSGNGYGPPPPPQPQPNVVYQQGTGQPNYAPDYNSQSYGQAGAPYPAGGYAQGGGYGGGYQPAPSGYQSRYGFERYERCLKDRGVAGGLVGAVVGAVIGNRVAGRGDRLGGSLIGGGLGALAGIGIEKATNKCRKYLPREDQYYGSGQQSGGYYPGSGYPGSGYPSGYVPQQTVPYPYPPQQSGGYYQNGWYYPAPVVTTITVSPAVTTTTTVTEEVYYETVKVAPRPKKKWKPKPKPRCTCR
jgi:hypothetical protein